MLIMLSNKSIKKNSHEFFYFKQRHMILKFGLEMKKRSKKQSISVEKHLT